jgi:hypothetical protein
MNNDSAHVDPPVAASFSALAADVLKRLQSAIADLLFGAGLDGARPAEIGRQLRLDKTLAWKISRFSRETNPLGAARHIPGVAGVKILLEAAETFGAPADRIEAVRRADAEFRRFVEERAGDPRTFEAMLTGSRRDTQSELEQRRLYYQSGAAVWGVRASAQFLMLALCPSERDSAMLDVVQTSGFIRLERLRPSTPWIVRRLSTTTDRGGPIPFVREPLDPSGVTAPGALPMLREFCEGPLAGIRQFQGADGITYDEILPGPLGPSGAVTLVTGEVYRAAVPSARSEDNRVGTYKLAVRTPARFVLFDVLVHEELAHFGPMMVSVAGLLEGRPPESVAEPRRAHASEPAPAKGLGLPPVLKTSRLPAYEAIACSALERAGRRVESFRGYRAAMEYPAAPSEICMTCDIK